MPTASNARLEYEAAQTLYAMAELDDSGDHKTFTSDAAQWSQRGGYAPVIRPNGVLTGGEVTPTAGQSDKIDVAAISCNLAGVVTAVAGSTGVSVSRGSSGDTHRITSITVTSLGAIAAVAGTASTAFSETRAAAGGPPLIPVGSIEVAQVRLTSVTSGEVSAAEIKQVPNVHFERANYPGYSQDALTGTLTFAASLPLIHTGALPKKVYAEVYEPVFVELEKASAFKPPETTHSMTSTTVYKQAIGSSSSNLGQGSFNALLEDGVTDPIVELKDEMLFFRFYPDEDRTANILCYGKLGIARQFPADSNIMATFTISAEVAASNLEA